MMCVAYFVDLSKLPFSNNIYYQCFNMFCLIDTTYRALAWGMYENDIESLDMKNLKWYLCMTMGY